MNETQVSTQQTTSNTGCVCPNKQHPATDGQAAWILSVYTINKLWEAKYSSLRAGIPTPPPRDHNHQRWPLRNRHTTAITCLALHPAAGTPVLTGTLTHVFSLKEVNYPYNKVHAGHQPSSNDSRMWILSFDIYFFFWLRAKIGPPNVQLRTTYWKTTSKNRTKILHWYMYINILSTASARGEEWRKTDSLYDTI